MSLAASLRDFDADGITSPVIGMRVAATHHGDEVPLHQHRQGQLVLALRGGVICDVPGKTWMVPPQCAVWIPWGMPHSVRATANAQISYLFVQPGAAQLPDHCCTLAVTPLVRELALHFADQPEQYAADSPTGRKATVLLEELGTLPKEHLHLPTSSEPRIQTLAKRLFDHPADRRTLAQWGKTLAMSERSLARLIQQETGLTFGRWRRQLHLIIAMQQLSAGQSVQRVAEHLGYDSVTAFITMFRKSVGKPPGRYFAQLAQPGQH